MKFSKIKKLSDPKIKRSKVNDILVMKNILKR